MDSRSRSNLVHCLNVSFILLGLIGSLCQANSPSTTQASSSSVIQASSTTTEDPHGGVPMGIPNKLCDNGKNFTSIDWDPSVKNVHTCFGGRRSPDDFDEYSNKTCEKTAKRPHHICFPENISYTEDIPTSGAHRPLWPVYGEYTYMPAQRWLHSLEHGAIVFLYHPCANQTLIDNFKAIAKSCIRRHIITPHKKMPSGTNFAVVSWMCKLLLSHPFTPAIVEFIKDHALQSPEWSVYSDGQYDIGLIKKASVVSDIQDSNLCPDMDVLGVPLKKSNKESRNYMSYYKRQEIHYPRIVV